MKPEFRKRMQAGEPLAGMVITLNAPEVAEIASEAGLDWLWLDMEHGLLDVDDVQRVCMAARQTANLARVPVNDEAWIKRVLDTGVDGLIIPQVNTPALARRAVEWLRYPPQGKRSVGAGRAHGYGAQFEAYLRQANEELILLIQIEHIEAVENLEEILRVEGISGVIVGPYDLSASLGKPGQLGDAEVVGAIARIREVCKRFGVPVGIFASDQASAAQRMREGFGLVAAGTDVMYLSAGLGSLVRGLRKGEAGE